MGSPFSSRSRLALIWDGGGCEEKWKGEGDGEREAGMEEKVTCAAVWEEVEEVKE